MNINELKNRIQSFELSSFGSITELESPYEKPHVYPKKNSHPRVLFNGKTIKTIRENLRAEENGFAYREYIKLSETECDGCLQPPGEKPTYNINYNVLSVIESKAFRYALTGEEQYGYEAILAIKNYLLTFVITPDLPDNCRAYGYIMYITACVYDWCYGLLTANDKEQLVAGCETLLAPYFEVKFPPVNQGAMVGHATEAQIQRDWFSLGVAAFDEYPDIYEFIAGRMYTQFKGLADFLLPCGSHWQGSAYGPYRFHFQLYFEALFRAINEDKPDLSFYGKDLDRIAVTFINYIRPDGQSLRIGDEFNELGKEYKLQMFCFSSFLASALFKNPYAKDFAKKGLKDFSVFLNNNNALTPVMFLSLNDTELIPQDHRDLPLVNANGSPLGSIIARSSRKDKDAVMTYMKIGEAGTGNHEHKDAGNFQIYYKGILASGSGVYDGYGTPHNFCYNKQTVSLNCITVFNPNMGDHWRWKYCGGQSIVGTRIDEKGTIGAWRECPSFDQAKMIGLDYCCENDEYRWSYLSGDLTNAYDKETAEEVTRYMFSVMTGDKEHPMAFFVYDRITAVDPTYKKAFLIHMQSEPRIEGNTAVITNTTRGNNGKLTVQSLLTDVTYEAIGGEGREFVANGINYPVDARAHELAARSLDENSDIVLEAGWGRIEISPKKAEKTDRLLTVMYVSDADKAEETVKAKVIESENAVGAVIFGKTVIFPKNTKTVRTGLSFTVEENKGNEYFAAGLEKGSWRVTSNGAEVGVYQVEKGELLNFRADGTSVEISKIG